MLNTNSIDFIFCVNDYSTGRINADKPQHLDSRVQLEILENWHPFYAKYEQRKIN